VPEDSYSQRLSLNNSGIRNPPWEAGLKKKTNSLLIKIFPTTTTKCKPIYLVRKTWLIAI